MNRTILVTGGAGFIGGHVARRLAERGDRVILLDQRPPAGVTEWLLAPHADRVRFVRADATRLPFADGSFDVAWTQHAAMNIADRPALYAELRRTAGRLALYDAIAGEGGPPEYPLPWAPRAELSFLVTEDELRTLLADAGFRPTAVRDATGAGLRSLRGLSLGPGFENLGRALDDGRLRLLQLVAA